MPSASELLALDKLQEVERRLRRLETLDRGDGLTNHSALSGLGDDDHNQYLRADGTRASTGVQTFGAGITFGNETLSTYDEGTWTPAITGSIANPTVTYSVQAARYTRFNKTVFFALYVQISVISGGSGDVRISLPFPCLNDNSAAVGAPAYSGGIDWPGTPINTIFTAWGGQAYGVLRAIQDNASISNLPISGLANGDFVIASGVYWIA